MELVYIQNKQVQSEENLTNLLKNLQPLKEEG